MLYHMPRSMCLWVSGGAATGFRQERSRRRLFPSCSTTPRHTPLRTACQRALGVRRLFLTPVLSLLLSLKTTVFIPQEPVFAM